MKHMHTVDLEFLSLKFRQQNHEDEVQFDKVWYERFYDAYDYLETNGLSGRIFGFSDFDVGNLTVKELSNNKDTENPFRINVPQKFLDFYKKIEMWLVRKQMSARFVELVIMEDRQKTGYLSNQQVHNCFYDVGMELTKKQIGQLTYCLHQSYDGNFSYPELFELLFGQDEWKDIQRRYKLRGRSMVSMVELEDKQRQMDLFISEELQYQLEYLYDHFVKDDLGSTADVLTFEEFFILVKNSGIQLSQSDRMSLEKWMQQNTERSSKISVRRLFQAFDISPSIIQPKFLMQKFLQTPEKERDVNQLLQDKKFAFADIIELLKKVGFDLNLVRVQQDDPSQPRAYIDDIQPDQYAEEFPAIHTMYKAVLELSKDEFGKKSLLLNKV